MMNTVNISGMSYDELVAMSNNELEAMIQNAQKVINDRKKAREDAINKAVSAYKEALSLGITEEEMKAYFSAETTQVAEEVTPIEEQVSINPKKEEEVSTPEPEVPPVEKTEGELTSMEELLSDDPEYKKLFAPKHPEKKSDRALPTMDELLSGEPINRILCLGNEVPDDKAYKQHYRISHAGGIIPTETATGQTIIYIPPVAA
jgi:hypothetical protein